MSIGGYIVQEFARFQEFRSVVTSKCIRSTFKKSSSEYVHLAWLVLAPVTDLAIAIGLALFLRGSRTGFASTDDLLTKLTRCKSKHFVHSSISQLTLKFVVTIQTGLITGERKGF